MNARLLIAGLTAAGCLLAQPPAGPRGRGPMGAGPMGMGRGMMEPAATVTGAAYSGVEVSTSQQVLATGNTIQRQEKSNVYRDSQGRVRRESTHTGPDGQTVTRVTISDPVAGTVTELDAATKTAFTRKLRSPGSQPQASGTGQAGNGRMQTMGARRQAPAADANAKRETLAAQTIRGIMATGTRVSRTVAAGSIGNAQAFDTVRETWTSDDLKIAILTKTSDPRVGTTVTELTDVNRSEPNASLFAVPADYTVKNGPGGPGGGRGPMGRGPARQRTQQ
jgi:hypothetical protein